MLIDQFVVDGLEDGGERSDTDSSTHQHTHLTIKDILWGVGRGGRGREAGEKVGVKSQ